MQHRGVGLEGEDQADFNRTSERLAALSTSFSNHVLDATQQWNLVIHERDRLRGVPERALEILAGAAAEAGDTGADGSAPSAADGPWRLGLDMPRYLPVITHAQDRALRETLYKAHVSRASSGELDNAALIEEILQLRREQAVRLGYSNWAELSLASKMADDVQAVETLLEELRSSAMPVAQNELTELRACAANQGADAADDLAPWDVSHWAEQLRRERFDLDQEALRPWFPLPRVLDGLFGLCERLFGIRIEAADGEAPVWHEDVRFFRVSDRDHAPLAAFYLDPFSRPASKRGGAWMNECLSRSRDRNGDPVLPVAYLICNQTPPAGDTPSLMSFEEVETLFHEFGHGLQHMLTTVDHPQAAGINNVEWDAVELPSQFMENWCLDRSTLMGMARHWQTDEPLPEADYRKLCSSRTFMQGNGTLRQVHFALTDLRLHSQWTADLGLTLMPSVVRSPTPQPCWLPLQRIIFSAPLGTSLPGGTPLAITPTSGRKCSAPMLSPPSKRWVLNKTMQSPPQANGSATRSSAWAAVSSLPRCTANSAAATPPVRPLFVTQAWLRQRPDPSEA